MKVKAEYTFDASAGEITFTGYNPVLLNSILLIINTTDNIIIYDLTDPLLGGIVATNVLTLTYDTSLMDDGDKLLIYYEDTAATLPVSGAVTVSGTATVNVADVSALALAANQQPGATTITEDYITCTVADTEYHYDIPAGTKKIFYINTASYAFRASYVTGKVAAPTHPYEPLASGVSGCDDNINLTSKIIYFASSHAGDVIFIRGWS